MPVDSKISAEDPPPGTAPEMENASPGSRYQNPPLECDLVMKGGITSGIVYPPAILELATRYRFRAVGGTSAGAIAAAATAAAEYGRETGGFERLAEVLRELQRDGFLRALFQPGAETRPLMDAAMDWIETAASGPGGRPVKLGFGLAGRVIRIVRRRASADWVQGGSVRGAGYGVAAALVLALIALLVTALLGPTGSLSGWWIFAATTALVLGGLGWWAGGVVGGVSQMLTILTRTLPNQTFYGLCTGRTEPGIRGAPIALTDWLHNTINQLAGRTPQDPPLTFGELEEKTIHRDGEETKVGMRLRMVTTNLSQHMPYPLPFERQRFMFSEAEFRRLFPETVVRHLIDHAHRSERLVLPAGFHFLPSAEKLPVVVASRMSLSFPVLFSAVPLYTINRTAFARRTKDAPLMLQPADLQVNWFSDGGISSNFPIHFFDSWLPIRPTFGISLSSLPEDAFGPGAQHRSHMGTDYMCAVDVDEADETAASGEPADSATGPAGEWDGESAGMEERLTRAVYLPRANDPPVPEWVPLGDLGTFFWSIFATAKGYRDTTQQMLPSYRERVVTIRLGKDEGGLNLAMPGNTIERVVDKGRNAGETLLHDFDFDHHRWVRFRVLMAQLEVNLKEMHHTLENGFCLSDLVEDQLLVERRYPYRREARLWCDQATERVGLMSELVSRWKEPPLFPQKSPQPEPVLRTTPRL